MTDPLFAELSAELSAHAQEHLLRFWDDLDASQRKAFADELRAIDFDQIEELYRQPKVKSDVAARAARAQGPPAVRLTDRPAKAPAAIERGEEALRAGRLGVLLVAGGQGSRLGFNHAKGMFPIGPVSGATLFQILIEKVRAVARRYGVAVPLYLMTSPATHDETTEFLERHRRFGLPAEDLTIFCQGTMPAVDLETGRLLLADKGHLCLSPDGHGGVLGALARSGSLDDLRSRGIEQLFYIQVDNPLVQVCDPEFIGYHLQAGSEISTQVVAKTGPRDRVGNVVSIDGKVQIIEYSDLPDELAERREADGSLTSWAGSVAVHVIDVAFLRRMADQADALPFHIARKKVPHLDEQGRHVEPQRENAMKFERFVFDLLPSAERSIVVEVDPVATFAPVKNAPGSERDSPETVQAQMVALHRRWLEAAGARVEPGVAVEISPLFALDEKDVAARIEPNLHVTQPRYFTSQ